MRVLWSSGGFLLSESQLLTLAASIGLLLGINPGPNVSVSAPVATQPAPGPNAPNLPHREPSAAASGYSIALLFGMFLALLPLLSLLLAGKSWSLRLAPAGWRPVPFVSLLERPG